MCVIKNSAFAFGLLMIVSQPALPQQVSVDPALFSRGVELYEEHCSVCHGDEGDGRGPLASGFSPRPRDFTKGSYKFRSTQVGEFPAEADLVETITRGISGADGQLMPSFDFLSDQDVLTLVEVLRFVSVIEEYGSTVTPSPRPAEPDLARGELLYQELRCFECHGESGDGQGDLAGELVDDNDLPIKPANLQLGKFKGGNAPEEIWMRIYTGLDGTPMPSFGGNTAQEDIWAIVEYVIRLGK